MARVSQRDVSIKKRVGPVKDVGRVVFSDIGGAICVWLRNQWGWWAFLLDLLDVRVDVVDALGVAFHDQASVFIEDHGATVAESVVDDDLALCGTGSVATKTPGECHRVESM